ncbi:MAG: two-component system chemotaxis response regulator CheY [Alphaproteobacteria bacterium]|jgi:two-component system chemotaxis response regulator CheY
MSQKFIPKFDPDALEKAKIGILVTEDDLDVAQLLDVTLRDLGIVRVAHAANGLNALRQYDRYPDDYDLIISDWQMPVMTGIELLRKIREINPTIPFLMLTARAQMDAVLSAKEADVTDYIAKPFSPANLRRKLESMIAYTRAQMAAPP